MPVVKSSKRVARRRVRPVTDRHTRVRPVCRLPVRAIGARRIVQGHGRRHANGHLASTPRLGVGAGNEMAAEREDDSVAGCDRGERLLERAVTRHPELVRVGVDHPVGVVLGRGKARHVGAPWPIAHDRVGHRNAAERLRAHTTENVGRPVQRLVIGGDDEVHAGVQVIPDLIVNDVRFVADDEGLNELHRARRYDRPSTRVTRREPRRASVEANELGLGEHCGVERVRTERVAGGRCLGRPCGVTDATECITQADVRDERASLDPCARRSRRERCDPTSPPSCPLRTPDARVQGRRIALPACPRLPVPRSDCSRDRNGKCRTSSGYQDRSDSPPTP